MYELTAFGRALRKIRLDRGLRLLDLARRLGLSAAFLSAIETGRKPIPDGYVTRVARALELTPVEIRDLRRAADRTRKEVRVDQLGEDDRELVAAFSRKLDEVPSDVLAVLRRTLLKSSSSEIPFFRSRRGIVVPAMSTAQIRALAEKFRSTFVDDDRLDFPIIEVLEFGLSEVFSKFFLDVRDEDEMGDDEGRVISGANSIILREDTYEAACKGHGRARFTACHELGHFLLHRSLQLARARGDEDKVFVDSEWQADTFAGSLLMSRRHYEILPNPEAAANKCKMTFSAAEVMWAKYSGEQTII